MRLRKQWEATVGMSGAMRLAKAIEAIVRTAEDSGQAVDVALVAQRLSVDFHDIQIPQAEIFELVARECVKHAGLAVVLEASPDASPRQAAPRPDETRADLKR